MKLYLSQDTTLGNTELTDGKYFLTDLVSWHLHFDKQKCWYNVLEEDLTETIDAKNGLYCSKYVRLGPKRRLKELLLGKMSKINAVKASATFLKYLTSDEDFELYKTIALQNHLNAVLAFKYLGLELSDAEKDLYVSRVGGGLLKLTTEDVTLNRVRLALENRRIDYAAVPDHFKSKELLLFACTHRPMLSVSDPRFDLNDPDFYALAIELVREETMLLFHFATLDIPRVKKNELYEAACKHSLFVRKFLDKKWRDICALG